jgi:ABC-type glycerol-3-phosphate transport system substrate-binding protein
MVPKLSDISSNLTVKQSAVSLGDYRNINHAKEILAALFFQTGNPIAVLSFDIQTNRENLKSALDDRIEGAIVSPSEAVLSFYTQFANPVSKEYTWNRSLPNSLDAFVAGDLAIYFGFGSEASIIRTKNPNLDFDTALFPQQKDVHTPVTYGKLSVLAILSSSKNQTGALKAVISMTGTDFLKRYQSLSNLPPVRRDLLVNVPTDSLSPILYKSTFYSKGWLDPQPQNTSSIFQTMVESSLAGNAVTSDVIQTFMKQFNLVIDQYNQKIQNN